MGRFNMIAQPTQQSNIIYKMRDAGGGGQEPVGGWRKPWDECPDIVELVVVMGEEVSCTIVGLKDKKGKVANCWRSAGREMNGQMWWRWNYEWRDLRAWEGGSDGEKR